VFSFHFESLRMLSEQHGKSSPEFITALYLLDAIVSQMQKLTSADKAVFDEFAIFYLSSIGVGASEIVHKLQKDLEMFSNFIVQQLPHMYIDYRSTHYDHEKAASLCGTLKTSLAALGLSNKVLCRDEIKPISKRSVFEVAQTTHTGTSNVAQMHIILWTMVILISVFFTVTCGCLAGISAEAEKDSTLYGATRTIFEKQNRKKVH